MKVMAIALNTFREAVRDRVLYLILVFAVLLIGASTLLSMLTVGSEEKIIKDFSLSMISLFGTAAALFIGIGLVYKEIEKRTVYTLLSKPIRRSEFLAGKYLGLCATLAVNLSVMSAAFYALLALRGFSTQGLWMALLLIYVELMLITAIAVFFSSFSTPILSGLFAGTLWVVGHLSWSLKLLEDLVPGAVGRGVIRFFYLFLPNLEHFNVRGRLVHGVPVSLEEVSFALIYGLAYTALVLLAASSVFQRRDFL
jgi:ABC-type transport system involved in multi-copper enzyme maturation permease subunit